MRKIELLQVHKNKTANRRKKTTPKSEPNLITMPFLIATLQLPISSKKYKIKKFLFSKTLQNKKMSLTLSMIGVLSKTIM